ncbi:DUF3105 domain-containing protein [Kitasatospora sp. NPDC057015]|uniref:DUF3105 domain-containing protein n=1 Tax=Kitasatospora sp. NPDC057015 TaxID=3346001 RepID=UPI00362762F0
MGSASKQSSKSNKPSGKQAGLDRRARIAELRAEEQRRDRRNKVIAGSIAGVLVIGAIATGSWIVVDANNKKNAKRAAAEAAANATIDGVQTFDNLSRNHVQTKVTYPQTPPVGGDHNPVWLDCMGHVYDQPVENERAVHSMEHGAVWVTYNAKATPDDIKALSEKVSATPYSLLSPYPDEAGTITLNAWGTQLTVNSASDPRIGTFFAKYVQGKQTQEPGASCTGPQ